MPYYGFEAIGDGQILTTAAAAGEDAALTVVTPGSAGVSNITGSALHVLEGTRSGKVQCVPGSLAAARYTGTRGARAALRWYLFLPQPMGTTDTFPVDLYSQAGGGHVVRYSFHSTGRMRLKTPAAQNAYTTTATIPVGSWVRFDLAVNVNTEAPESSQLRLTMALGDTAETIDDSGWITTSMSRTPDGFRFGKIDSGKATETYYLDAFTYAPGAQDVLGPSITAPAQPNVTLTVTHPTSAGASDGTITAAWDPVPGADYYEAGILPGHVMSGAVAQQSPATSPHQFTGLTAGHYTVTVRGVRNG